MRTIAYLSMALVVAGAALMPQPALAAKKKKCTQFTKQSQCTAQKHCKWVGKAHVNKCQKR